MAETIYYVMNATHEKEKKQENYIQDAAGIFDEITRRKAPRYSMIKK